MWNTILFKLLSFKFPKFDITGQSNNRLYNARKARGLNPDTVYYYRVWFSTPHLYQENSDNALHSDPLVGSFRTAPDPSSLTIKPISFIFAADLGGQKHCRQAATGGYSIFKNMTQLSPDFFIANGDMIYAR